MTIRSEDAYLSTVIGTLAADEGSVPQQIPTRTRSLELFPERKIPEVFWNQNEFRYSESAQKRAAPLIFIVAGTGASHRSSKMHYLGRLFFSEGFHVIALSSPTHPNFILAASSSGHPGFAPEDSEDLYRVMKEAYSALASKVEITEVHLTGYSLGGTQSAFLLAIDDREEAFHFEKVLMINPSVDLFASVRILDGLFRYALPDGAESVTNLIKRLLVEISDYSQQNGRRRVDGEMLYKIAEKRIAEGKPPTKKALAGLIAEAFRLSASNMFFTVDVLAAEGRLVKKGTKLKVGTSLTPYFSRSIDWSFERYFNEVLLPYWQSRLADLDREALIERASLRSLERMLSEDPRIAAVTNADDIILTPEDLEFLRTSMGDRIKIYPRGGHCGNLSYRENSDYMIRFFQGGGALNKRMLAALLLLLVTVNIGCATGTAPSSDADPIAQAVYDPWEPMNRHTYRYQRQLRQIRLRSGDTGVSIRRAPIGSHRPVEFLFEYRRADDHRQFDLAIRAHQDGEERRATDRELDDRYRGAIRCGPALEFAGRARGFWSNPRVLRGGPRSLSGIADSGPLVAARYGWPGRR